jgi:hypothetical protein
MNMRQWLRAPIVLRWRTIGPVSSNLRLKEASCSLLLVSVLGGASAVRVAAQSSTIDAAQPRSANAAHSKAIASQAASDRQRALRMLDPLFEATGGLDSDLTRIYLQIRIADMLWEYDEPRARLRFGSALAAADSVKAESFRIDPRPQFRSDVLNAIKQHDPKWATKLALGFWDRTKKQEPDMWTIMLLLDTDTQYAIQLIRREIDSNRAASLQMYLENLRREDPVQADDLFTYALSVAERRSKGGSKDFGALFGYVFPSRTRNYTEFSIGVGTSPSPLKPEVIARFLAFGYKALIQEADLIERESGKDKQIGERSGIGYMTLQLFLPFFDRYTPDNAVKIRTRWDEVILGLKGGKDHIRQCKLLFGPMTSQDALRNAEHAKDPQEKLLLYMRAAKLAAQEGNFDHALSILTSATDAGTRSDLEQQILVKAAELAIDGGGIDTAYRYAKGVQDLRGRTELLCGIVWLLQQRKDAGRATQVLNEALESARKSENNRLKVSAMLNIANAATLLDPVRGFELMNETVEVINKLDATNFALGNTDFDQNLLSLARQDFDRALLLAEKLKDKESLLIARIAVCRGILTKQ